MLFIGRLEQLKLTDVLQRLEAFAKTGLLVIRQDTQSVELYFRDGRLVCIGPMRSKSNLGERLLQAGVISQPALQETMNAVGGSQISETRMALALMDLGHVSRDELRAWSAKEAIGIIQVLLTWTGGEIYFGEGQQTPPERLLIALPITSLLPVSQSVLVAASAASENAVQKAPIPTLSVANLAQAPTRVDPARFLTQEVPRTAPFSTPEPSSLSDALKDSGAFAPLPSMPQGTLPAPPDRIDTSFMRPEMVLLPTDLSMVREQNIQILITPQQWRVLTRVDGRTSLQTACHELAMSPETICQVAGELLAQGLIYVSMPVDTPVNELSPVSRNLIISGLGNGHVNPGYMASPIQPFVAVTPTTDSLSVRSAVTAPVETQSQWGNGGNGATFVPGRGWVLASQSLQPLQPSGPIRVSSGVYAQIGAH